MSLTDSILLEPYRDSKDIWIAFRRDGNMGSGTINDPYNGSTQPLFDGIMNSRLTSPNLRIHLGPGVFETKGSGHATAGVGWKVLPGWKIIGAGIDKTILKVVGAANASQLHGAIGAKIYTDRADDAEVCDLTVDCNMGGNPGMAVGAVGFIGSHTRVRRVRAINFGTETSNVECFVISVASAHPQLEDSGGEFEDCVIEDCIAEQPWENNVRETTVLIVSKALVGDRTAHPRASVIRNNYVNTEFANGVICEVASIDFGDGQGGFTEIGTLPPVAILLDEDRNLKDPYVFIQGIIRNNVIRQVNGLMESRPGAITVGSFEKLVIENNTIDLAKPDVMQHIGCGAVHYFNNRDSKGNLIQGQERFLLGPNKKIHEVSQTIEDALVLGF